MIWSFWFFKIKNIEIKNNFFIKQNEIEEKLSNTYKKNIFSIKKADIEKPLKEIDFLERIEVKRKYPNTVIIKIFETRPIAVLFKKKVKYLLDSSSNLIFFDSNINHSSLPNVFGEGAENNFLNFFHQNKFPR